MILEDDARELGVPFGSSGDARRRVRYWIRWEGTTHEWSAVVRGGVAHVVLDGREREVPLAKFKAGFGALQFHVVQRAFLVALARFVRKAKKARDARVRPPRPGMSYYVKKSA